MKTHIFRISLFTLVLLASLIYMPVSAVAAALGEDVWENNATAWQGRIWYLKTDSAVRPAALYSIAPGDTNKPRFEKTIDVNIEFTRLLNGGDKIWIISLKTVSYFKDGSLFDIDVKNNLSVISRPFIYKGNPAAVDQIDNEFYLYKLSNGNWQIDSALDIDCDNNQFNLWHCLQIINTGNGIPFFFEWNGKDIYYHSGIPFARKNSKVSSEWKLFSNEKINSGFNWSATTIDGKPAFFAGTKSFFNCRINGFVYEGSGWKQIFRGNGGYFNDCESFGVYPAAEGKIIILNELTPFFGPTYATTFDGSRQATTMKIGGYPMVAIFDLVLLPLVVFLIIQMIGPFWWFKTGIKLYQESRTFPQNQVNISRIMEMDFSDASNYKVKKWPARKAITFSTRVSPFAWPSRHAIKAGHSSLQFIQSTHGITLKLVCRFSPTYILVFLFIIALSTILFLDFTGASDTKTILCSYATLGIALFMPCYIYFYVFKSAKKQGNDLFELILDVLDIEKQPVTKMML